MTAERDYTDYLRDIVEHIDKAERFIAGMSFDAFVADERTNFAVVRALEIIGEASKRVPSAAQARYPEVEWRKAVGMRNKLTHQYSGIDLRVVWETVHRDLPSLRVAVGRALNDLERRSS